MEKCAYCGNVHVISECNLSALNEIRILKDSLRLALLEIDRLNTLNSRGRIINDDDAKVIADAWWNHHCKNSAFDKNGKKIQT